MLSLKDFKSFEVKNIKSVQGGADKTSHTSGEDSIETIDGVTFMTVNGDWAGCRCDNGSFSDACC